MAEHEIKPFVQEADEKGECPRELFDWGFKMGLHMLEIPAQYGGTYQCIFYRIDLNLCCIRNLFYTYNNLHREPPSYLYSLFRTFAMVMRWIWLVPSKIWNTFTSRISFSTGYSLL